MTVVDLVREQAKAAPDHPALVVDARDGRTTISYSELARRFEQRARNLLDQGAGSAWRIGLHAGQGAGFVEMALGILAAGSCMVPIPQETDGEVLADFCARARVHGLVREDDGFELRPRRGAGPVEPEFAALGPAYLRFTSGTTNERKGVILGHEAVVSRLEAANRGLGITPGDRILWLLPMAHHFVVSVLLYLSRGATVLLPASSLARDVLSLARDERATLFYASPYHYNLLAKDASEAKLEGVRLAISTAEGLRAELALRFRTRYGIPLAQALGIIEVGLPVINLASPESKPEALGRPLADYDVWLRDESGEPVEQSSPERTGEICIRGKGLFDAYLDPWMLRDQVVGRDGFRTGDQGWFDADGDLHLVGRRANRINMAGMKFFAEEVEAVLDQHTSVLSSRVVALEHAHLGEIPTAEIVLEPGADAPDRKELTRFCAARLPRYKVPRKFTVVDELPMTATGKLERRSERPKG